MRKMLLSGLRFLSTPSARRATRRQDLPGKGKGISIHALREEGDTTRRATGSYTTDFYPRPPRGGRRIIRDAEGDIVEISIHALREEGDESTSPKVLRP